MLEENGPGMPGQIFVHLAFLWFLFWFGVMLMLAWARAHACRLSSNWLVRLSGNGVLVKFRSFQNHYYPDTDPAIIELSWRDISWVRKTKETNHRGRGDDSMTEFFTYLDMKLHLPAEQLDKMALALRAEKQRKPPRLPGNHLKQELLRARRDKKPKHEIEQIKSRIKLTKLHKPKMRQTGVKYDDVPVRLLCNAILRIRWNAIKPGIKDTLSCFAAHTRVDEAVAITTDSTANLQGKELEDMILERLDRGDRFEAIALVKSHYGMNTSAARQFLDELSGSDGNQNAKPR